MPIPDSAREVILSEALAHLVTLNSDGSPQVTCVWTGIEDDEIVVGHLRYHRKLKNIGRDPRVAISWETERQNSFGLTEYLVAYGTARITEGGAPQLLQELAHVYLGPGVRFPAMPDPSPGWVLRIRPERFAGVGPWASPG